FDFGVAVGAEEQAFARLLPHRLECQRNVSDLKPLLLWVEMMEFQRPEVLLVATEPAPAACIRDQDLLDPTPAAGHAAHTALLASKVAATFKDELRLAVFRTAHRERFEPCPLCIASKQRPAGRLGPQAVSDEPTPHNHRRDTEFDRHLGDCLPRLDQTLQ